MPRENFRNISLIFREDTFIYFVRITFNEFCWKYILPVTVIFARDWKKKLLMKLNIWNSKSSNFYENWISRLESFRIIFEFSKETCNRPKLTEILSLNPEKINSTQVNISNILIESHVLPPNRNKKYTKKRSRIMNF